MLEQGEPLHNNPNAEDGRKPFVGLPSLSFGSQLGWFIDPSDRSILVFRPGQQPQLFQGNDRLPVLDAVELELTVSQLFSWLNMGN